MKTTTFEFDAIGTHWEILIGQPPKAFNLTALLKQVQARLDKFDKHYSRFRHDSLVANIARQAGSYQLPDDGLSLLQFYEQLYGATDGLVTPLIGQVMADAGYDAQYSFQPKALKQPPHWEAIITYDAQHIEVKQPVLLDFGAAGKGYAVDLIDDLFAKAGLTDYTINASGDILHRSQSQQLISVGLENPRHSSEVIGIAHLGNQSLCASSGSRRKWGVFHHIINPITLQPAEHIIATWVIAANTMTADGLATALFFTEPQKLQTKFSFAYALLDENMKLSYSKNFPVEVFEAHHA